MVLVSLLLAAETEAAAANNEAETKVEEVAPAAEATEATVEHETDKAVEELGQNKEEHKEHKKHKKHHHGKRHHGHRKHHETNKITHDLNKHALQYHQGTLDKPADTHVDGQKVDEKEHQKKGEEGHKCAPCAAS